MAASNYNPEGPIVNVTSVDPNTNLPVSGSTTKESEPHIAGTPVRIVHSPELELLISQNARILDALNKLIWLAGGVPDERN